MRGRLRLPRPAIGQARIGSMLRACVASMLRVRVRARVAAPVVAIGAALAGFAVDAAERRVPDTIAQRVQACTTCHGKEGRATSAGWFPRIAGKPAGYLFEQLRHFRDGRRQNAAMAGLVEHLTDDYLREIAAYFAALDLPYAPPAPAGVPAAVLERGETLVKHGDPARALPACASCHGEQLTGVAPAIPGLLGLPQDYIVGQFAFWTSGQRRAARPDCMAQIVARLSADDIRALAAWLASRPVPVPAHPAAGLAKPLPIVCGSVGDPIGKGAGGG